MPEERLRIAITISFLKSEERNQNRSRPVDMGAKRTLLVLVAATLASGAFGCLNDRDTESYLPRPLSDEQTEILKATVGWFPVHSDAYYKARIQGAEADLKSNPNRFDLYDDIAVAYDRLGQDGKAIEVIERKRKVLETARIAPKVQAQIPNPTPRQISDSSKDPWYRYYANAGTFWAHRWLKEAKRDPAKNDWIDLAQRDIDEAIRLNPQAHGLREFAQSEVIRWIRTGDLSDHGQTLYDFLPEDFWKKSEAALALGGLVTLGGAWESPDVFQALGQHYADSGYARLAFHLSERVRELQENGKKSLTGRSLVFSPDQVRRPLHLGFSRMALLAEPTRDKDTYHRYRIAAETMRKDLIAYEDARIAKGDMPDKDPNFYASFKSPDFPDYWNEERESYRAGQRSWGLATSLILAISLWGWNRARLARNSGDKYAELAEFLMAIISTEALALYVGYAAPLDARILLSLVLSFGAAVFVGRSGHMLLTWIVAMIVAGSTGGFGVFLSYSPLFLILSVLGCAWGANLRKASHLVETGA